MKGWYGNGHRHSLASKGVKSSEYKKALDRVLEENPTEYGTIRFARFIEKLKSEKENEVRSTNYLRYGIMIPHEIPSRDDMFGEILDEADRDYGLDDRHVWELNEYADVLYEEYLKEISL